MRKFLLPVAVLSLGFAAGAAISGLPKSVADDVSIDDVHVVESTAAVIAAPGAADTTVSTDGP